MLQSSTRKTVNVHVHVRNCMKFAYNSKREESFLIPPKFLEKKKKNSKEQTKILLPPEEQVFSVLLVH